MFKFVCFDRSAIPPRETAAHHQRRNAGEDDSSWMEGCF